MQVWQQENWYFLRKLSASVLSYIHLVRDSLSAALSFEFISTNFETSSIIAYELGIANIVLIETVGSDTFP